MKKIIVLIVMLNVFQQMNVEAQAGNWGWARQGTGNGDQEGWGVTTDAFGNIYAIGSLFYDSTITFGPYTLTSAGGGCDMFLVKYSSTGSVIWAKSAGGTGYDFVNSIATDASGNVYITGYFTSNTIIFGNDTLTDTNNTPSTYDMFIAKYDSNGNIIWVRDAGGISDEAGCSVAVDILGNVYVTGWFQSPTFVFGSYTLTNMGSTNIFIVKYSPSGTVLWAKSAGGTGNDYGYSVATDPSGQVYIVGRFLSPTIVFGANTLVNAGLENIFIIKYSSIGTELWSKSASGSGQDNAYAVVSDVLGNVYVTGQFQSPTLTFGTINLTITGSSNMFIVKYDSIGTALVAKSADGVAGFSLGQSLATTHNVGNSSGINIYATGGFTSSTIIFDSDTINFPTGATDPMFVVKYDQNLNVICATVLPSGGDDKNCVATDGFGNAYIVGDFYSTNFIIGTDTLALIGSENFFIAKYYCDGIAESISEIQNPSSDINLFPNPTSTSFTIESRTNKIESIKVFNILGCEVLKQVQNNQSVTINCNRFSKGIYFVEITDDKKNVVNRKVVVE